MPGSGIRLSTERCRHAGHAEGTHGPRPQRPRRHRHRRQSRHRLRHFGRTAEGRRACGGGEPRSGAQREGRRHAESAIERPRDRRADRSQRRGGGRSAVQDDARRIRPARHPGQQRHQHLAGQLLCDDRGELGPGLRQQAARHGALHPPCGAADARAQMGAHRQRLRRRGLDAAARRHRHRHQQRGGAEPHRGAGQRTRQGRHPGQRHRADRGADRPPRQEHPRHHGARPASPRPRC